MVVKTLPTNLLYPPLKAKVQTACIGLSEVVHAKSNVKGRIGDWNIGRGSSGPGKEAKHGFNRSFVDGEAEGVFIVASVGVLVLLCGINREGDVMRSRFRSPPVEGDADTLTLLQRRHFTLGGIRA